MTRNPPDDRPPAPAPAPAGGSGAGAAVPGGAVRLVAAVLLGTGLLGAGLLAAGVVFAAGWPLPRVERCSGDVCETTSTIDWDRVEWRLKPRRLACGEVDPGPRSTPIGPGDVCVIADGTGNELDRASYETLQRRWLRRRVLTLTGSAGLLGGAATAAVLLPLRLVRRPPAATGRR